MPGSGKSTVGKTAAKRLGLPFVDSDSAIESRAGRSIASLFASDGEAAFRAMESDLLVELLDSSRGIVATGGGIVLSAANREVLLVRAQCVYLRASHALLWRRLQRDRRRPLLQVADPKTRLRQMLDEREPLYVEAAHHVVATDHLPFHDIVAAVVRCARGQTP
jgi:shikimate kinase